MYVLKRILSFLLVITIIGISYLSCDFKVYAAKPAFEQNTAWEDYDPANSKHYLVDARLSSSNAAARKYKTLKEAADFLSLDPFDGGSQELEAVVFVANGTYSASSRFTQQYSRLGMPDYPAPRNGYSALTSLAIIGQSQNGVIINGGFTSAGERVSEVNDGVCGIMIIGKNITVKNLTIQNIKPGDGTGTTNSYKDISYGLLLYPLNNLAPVYIENCNFRYTPDTRLAALKMWGMGIAIDDPTIGKYFGDKSDASVTIKGCSFDSLNTGIWLEENRGEIFIADNSFDNIIPFGTSQGRGVRIYNQVHPSYTAASGPGAGGAPLEYGTQTVQNCTFTLPYGGVAVLCDVGTPTPAGGTNRSLVTVKAFAAKGNVVNIIKGADVVYDSISPAFKRDTTAFLVRNIETNPLNVAAPSFERIDIRGNTVNVSPEAAQSDFYSGQILNGVGIAGNLSRINGYGAVKVNRNIFRGITPAVSLTEHSTVSGTIDSGYVDATHNLHYTINGNLIDEYRPLEGQYVTVTGDINSQFNVESYEPFFVDMLESELSFEELFILDIYNAKTNQKIQSSYAFDKEIKEYIIDDLSADVDNIYFIVRKVEKGTQVLLTHVETDIKQELEDDANLVPVPSQVYALTSAQPTGVDTFVFELSTVNNNIYKDENNRNKYTIQIKREIAAYQPEPEPRRYSRRGLESYSEPNLTDLVTIEENEVPLTGNPSTGSSAQPILVGLCACNLACSGCFIARKHKR